MSSKKEMLNLVLIGARNSGKTVYLSTLWGKGLLRDLGAPTQEYLKLNWDELEKNNKLPATEGNRKVLNFTYTQNKKIGKVSLSIPDFDGYFAESLRADEGKEDDKKEVLSEEEEGIKNTKTERAGLKADVKSSKGCIFFVPFEKDPDRLKDFATEIDAFIQLAEKKNYELSPIPATLVVTKWDESEFFKAEDELEKVKEYISKNTYLNRILTLIESSFKQVEIIPLSSFKTYNLLKPIDFSLEKTFEHYFKKAKELEEKKEFEKLCLYLSNRWEDIQYCKAYDFHKLYNLAQEEFAQILKKKISQENIENKENLINKYKSYFITNDKKFKEKEKEVESERNRITRNQRLKFTGAFIAGLLIIVYAYLYISKSKASEEYNVIISGYEKGMNYKKLKKPIDTFLQNYKVGDFSLTLSSIKSMRNKLNKIKVELQQKENNLQEKILEDDNLTADEKQNQLTLKTTITPEVKQSLANAKALQIWKGNVENCLHNSCTQDDNGLAIIENLLTQVDSLYDDGTVQKSKKELLVKQSNIKKHMDEEELKNWKAKVTSCLQSECTKDDNGLKIVENLLAKTDILDNEDENVLKLKDQLTTKVIDIKFYISLDQVESFDEMTSFVNTQTNITVGNAKLILSKLKQFNELENIDIEKYNNLLGTEPFKELYKEIVKKVELEKNVEDAISKVETANLNDLQNIEIQNYNEWSPSQQQRLKDSLDKRYSELFKSKVLNEIPDLFNQIANNSWKSNKYDSFIEKCNIQNIGYSYKYSNHQQFYKISKHLEDLNKVERLRTQGISNISVSIKGKKDNSIDFHCGIGWNGKKMEDIIIEGFSSKLTYENDGADECNNDTRTFKNYITLNAQTYSLHLTEWNIVNSYDLENQSVNFSLLELWQLSNGETIPKLVDDEKIELRFKRKW